MGYALAGLAIAAVGAGTSAYGTAQNAQAVGDMAMFNIALADKFGKRWTENTDDLIAEKNEKLYNSGDIFQRFESTGAFGDNIEVLDNLRKAQSDFAALAAGDFSGFESQLDRIMKDNLNATFGAGAPIGTYTDLSAEAIMGLRRTGLAEASQTTGFLNDLTNSLLGVEFGIMDQGFNLKYQIDKDRTNAIMGYGMQGAQTEGVGMQAAGNALQSIGSSIFSYGMYQGNQQASNPVRAADPYSTPVNGYYQPVPYGGYGSAAPVAPAAPAYPSVIPTGYTRTRSASATPSYVSDYTPGGYGDLPTLPPDGPMWNPNGSGGYLDVGYGVLPPSTNQAFNTPPIARGPSAAGYGFNQIVVPGLGIAGQ